MTYRKFVDRNGRAWHVMPLSRREWEFDPVSDNPEPRRLVQPPSYERDPFEMSTEELQQLLDTARTAASRPKKSPFQD